MSMLVRALPEVVKAFAWSKDCDGHLNLPRENFQLYYNSNCFEYHSKFEILVMNVYKIYS